MSESMTDAKSSEPKPVSTRRRMWRLRWINNGVFFVPLWPLLIGVDAARAQNTLDGMLLFGMPWAGLALVSGVLARALWRIEVNLDGNARPFTERDLTVLRKASAALIGMICGISAGYFIAGNIIARTYGGISEDDLFEAGFTPIIISFMLFAVSACFVRVYAKGKQAHEELEKGV